MKIIKKKAFTLTEIMIGVLLVTVILTVAYKLVSGVLGQMFKSSTKMTNLRAASIILERIKSDMRCAVVPVGEDEKFVNENGIVRFYATNDNTGNKNKVTYTYNEQDGTLKRQCSGKDRTLSSAKVSSFSVVISDNKRYLTVNIEVDNEKDNQYRSFNSTKNKILLQAVLYPRFLTETLTDEEKFWNKTSQSGDSTE